jgi:hypothetical protein
MDANEREGESGPIATFIRVHSWLSRGFWGPSAVVDKWHACPVNSNLGVPQRQEAGGTGRQEPAD